MGRFSEVNWSISSDAGGSWLGNVYTSANVGDWTVTASFSGLQATAQIQVLNATGAPTVSVVQSGTQNTTIAVDYGAQFNVDLRIDNGSDIWGWSMRITWNPANVILLNVTEGPYLQQVTNSTLFFAVGVNNHEEEIDDVNMGNFNVANGSGVLATLTFQAVGAGNSSITIDSGTSQLDAPPINITSAHPVFPNIPFVAVNAVVSFSSPIDFYHTGIINFQNIIYFVTAYISYYQTGMLDPACDLNHDGTLNFQDIQLFVQDYIAYGESV